MVNNKIFRYIITFSNVSEKMQKKRGNCTGHVKVMCVKRRTIIRRICLSSQSSLRSWPPHPSVEPYLGEGVNSNHMFSFQLPPRYLRAAVSSSAGRALVLEDSSISLRSFRIESHNLLFVFQCPPILPSAYLTCMCWGDATCFWGA